MLSKYHRNGVLTGDLDCYCLVCKLPLQNQGQVAEHVEQLDHRNNFDKSSYLEVYRQVFIRKVARGYYCEQCNILLTSKIKCKAHLEDETHVLKKTEELDFDDVVVNLIRVDNGIIAMNDMLLSDEAWNTFIDDCCVICEIDIDNYDEHKNLHEHIINLIKTQIKMHIKGNLYRELNNEVFQCLTCNIVVSNSNFNKHFDDISHKRLRLQSRKEKKAAITASINNMQPVERPETIKLIDNEEGTGKNKEKTINTKVMSKENYDICKRLNIKDYIHIANDTIICLLCEWKLTRDNITNHINSKHHQSILKIHNKWMENNEKEISLPTEDVPISVNSEQKKDFKNNSTVFQNESTQIYLSNEAASSKESNVVLNTANNDIKNRDQGVKEVSKELDMCESSAINAGVISNSVSEVKKYAKENNITYNDDQKMTYCRLCDIKIPNCLNNLKEHVGGKTHIKNKIIKAKNDAKSHYTVVNTKKFIITMTEIDHYLMRFVLINDKYVLDMFKFATCSKLSNGTTLKCHVCDDEFPQEFFSIHVFLETHTTGMQVTPVVNSLSDEFVREVRPGKFHCGYCNIVETSWEILQIHLNSQMHNKEKMDAQRMHFDFIKKRTSN